MHYVHTHDTHCSEKSPDDTRKFSKAEKNITKLTRPTSTTLDDVFGSYTTPSAPGTIRQSVADFSQSNFDTNEKHNQESSVDPDSMFSFEDAEEVDVETGTETTTEDFIDQPTELPTPQLKTNPLPPFEMMNFEPHPLNTPPSTIETSCSDNSANSVSPDIQGDLFNVQLAPESISQVETIDILDCKGDFSDTYDSPESLELNSEVSMEIAELLQELRATSINIDSISFDGMTIKKRAKGVEFTNDTLLLEDFSDDCFDHQTLLMPSSVR